MKRRLVVAALTLACMAISSVVVTGCAYRRADRSLVQPLAFSKKQFTGEWYYMKTVYEAPYESGYFTGQGGWPLGSKIRFEITERYLYAFNASTNIRNSQSEVTPIAAWPISRHFDIKARLNYSTGEPSNVIVEESFDGIPWYQRQYVRVHWESSVISDMTSIGETLNKWWYRGAFYDEPARYVPPEKVQVEPEYMTFVVDRLVSHRLRAFYNMWLQEIPASSFRVRMRHAFKKVKASSYTPKEYNDYMISKFGVFRTNIVRYHPDRGLVDWSYKFYANRHNIASKDELAAGTKPTKIIYYLSPGWPEDLRDAVIQVGNDWNAAMAYALQRDAKDANGVNAVFEVLPNAWKEGVCTRDKMWECNFETTKIKREVGDLRYNLLWWVTNPQTGSPLGYGPSFADPDTGEIVVGMAYIYGAGFRVIVERYMALFDMLSGRYTDDQITNGTEYFNSVFGLNGHTHLLGADAQTKMKQNGGIAGVDGGPGTTPSGMVAPRLRLNTTNKLLARIKSPEFITRMLNTRKLDRSMITANLSRFDTNPKIKAMLQNDFVSRLAFPHADPLTAMASPDAMIQNRLKLYQANEMVKPHNLQKLLSEYMYPSKMNMFMPEYADPILDSFVQWHVQKKTPRDEVRKAMLQFMFRFTTAHEVGHTLGLMHNFRGSTDEYNFHNPYHDLKEGKTPTKCYANGNPCDPDKIDTTIKDIDGTPAAKGWYRGASVMDYPGEMYDASIGVGKTDKAAIAFIYSGLVEKAVSDPRQQGDLIKWNMKVEADNLDPKNSLKLRPFRYCSDYARGQDPFCQVWDSRHTATGIVEQIILQYDRTYPLTYWRRGRRTFGPGAALNRNLFRFQHIALIYQDLAYRITTQPGYEQTDDFKDKLKAVQKGYSFFIRLINAPDVGLHELDQIDGVYKTRPIDEDTAAPKIDIKLGEGRHFFSQIQDGYWGTAKFRFNRIGALYDKWLTMQLLSVRSWGYYNNSVNWLFTNFYDLFPDDTKDLFATMITDVFDKNSPLLYRKCFQDTSGNCKKDANGKIQYATVAGRNHPILQVNAMIYGLALLNNQFHDNTFSNNMLVGIKGSGSSWTPPGMGEVKCPPINTFTGQFECDTASPVVCFNNYRGTRTYFAMKSQDGTGITHRLVKRACELGNQLAVLKKSGAARSFIERKEGELENLETMTNLAQMYGRLFSGQ